LTRNFHVSFFLLIFSLQALAVPVVPAIAARKEEGGIEWQFYGLYGLDVLKISTTRGDANFTGNSVGAGISQRLVTRRGNGFASRGEIGFRSLSNTANAKSTSESESLSATSFLFGLRLYTSELYLGAYAAYMPFTVKYTNTTDSTKNSEQGYNGFGLGIEVGVDLFLSNTLFVSPRAEYHFYSAQASRGATDGKRVSGYGLTLGAGLVF
jgi:hypothetical protein